MIETCDLCGITAQREEAIDAGWIPAYFCGGKELLKPVCPKCVKERLCLFGEDFVLDEVTIQRE